MHLYTLLYTLFYTAALSISGSARLVTPANHSASNQTASKLFVVDLHGGSTSSLTHPLPSIVSPPLQTQRGS